jgi:uncharacterized protein YqjF (DUF2071 family)
MATPVSDERVRFPVLLSQWLTVTFVHWPVEPAAVQALLPPGLTVDRYADQAWLTLAPFRMVDVGPPGPAALRRLSFAETNFRTYVRAPNRQDGIYFLTITAVSALMTVGARITAGIPYRLGDLSVVEHDGMVSYGGARRDGSCSYRVDVRPRQPLLEPTPLDVWLTGRWRAYSWHLGRLLETPVEHEPWPLSAATLEGLHETIAASFGLPGAAADRVVHFSEGVRHVRLGASRRVRPV